MINNIKNPIRLVAYFLVPGLLVALAYTVIVNPVIKLNLSSIVSLGIAGLIIMIPVELGIIIFYSKKQFGIYSIKKMITYDKSLPIKHYLLLVPLILLWIIVIMVFGKGLDEFIKGAFFFMVT